MTQPSYEIGPSLRNLEATLKMSEDLLDRLLIRIFGEPFDEIKSKLEKNHAEMSERLTATRTKLRTMNLAEYDIASYCRDCERIENAIRRIDDRVIAITSARHVIINYPFEEQVA